MKSPHAKYESVPTVDVRNTEYNKSWIVRFFRWCWPKSSPVLGQKIYPAYTHTRTIRSGDLYMAAKGLS